MTAVRLSRVTRAEDAALAVAAGIQYLAIHVDGRTPWSLDRAEARRVVEAAGGTPVIGVFGVQALPRLLHTCRELSLTGVQLDAMAPRDMARRIRDAGFSVWRTVRLGGEADLGWIAPAREHAAVVLVETAPGAIFGMDAPTLPLYLAREARAQLPGSQMALAAGLHARTVSDAVAFTQADIVDVSTGVESRPGIKDPELLLAFMEAVVGQHSSS